MPLQRFCSCSSAGSGITPQEYERRRESRPEVFDAAMDGLSKALSFALLYVTAPADGIFLRLADDAAEAARWTRHVETELLPDFGSLRFYVVGYSGGAALAFAGPHALGRCIGGGGLGADAIPADMVRGPGWHEPAALYYNRGDRVFAANHAVIQGLEGDEIVKHFVRLPGSHALADYVSNESFGGLVRRAARLAAKG
jgi:hypothetical protein